MSESLKYYVEVTLISDGITPVYDIWKHVFRQTHLALVDAKNPRIGLSFPGYRYEPKAKRLGEKLRIFAATEAELNVLDVGTWLSQVDDYCHVSKIRPVPDDVRYACFGRKHYKTNYEKIIKGKMLHLGISEAEAKSVIGEFRPAKRDLPYVHYQSLSSMTAGESADMIIAIQKKDMDSEVLGSFNSFGLSNTATVPVF